MRQRRQLFQHWIASLYPALFIVGMLVFQPASTIAAQPAYESPRY